MKSKVRRSRKVVPFAQVSNSVIQDPNLSARAKGLYSYLMSLPGDWIAYKTEIIKHFKEGRDAMNTAWSELQQYGLLESEQIIDDSGRFAGYNYIFHFYRNTEIPCTENPSSGNPSSENPPLTKKDSTKKELTNTHLIFKSGDYDLDILWRDWVQHRKERKAPITPKAAEFQKAQIQGVSIEDAKEMIKHSIASGYQGLFPPKKNTKSYVAKDNSGLEDRLNTINGAMSGFQFDDDGNLIN